jgi:hypothetical protein
MEPQLEDRLMQLEQKVEKIYISVEKTRKYFLWSAITTVAFFVLPLIGLAFALPSFLSSYTSTLTEPGTTPTPSSLPSMNDVNQLKELLK